MSRRDDEPDLDAIRVMRRLHGNGLARAAIAKIVNISFTTVDRYVTQFKIDQRAKLTGDIPELEFLPRKIFHLYAAEAKRRKMSNVELFRAILTLVAVPDKKTGESLFGAVLDYKEDNQDGEENK